MSVTAEDKRCIHGALLHHSFFGVLLMLAKATFKSYRSLVVLRSGGSIYLDYKVESSASATLRLCSL